MKTSYRVCALSGATANLLLLGTGLHAQPSQPADNRLNVLMLIADDMRPEMGCYGIPYVQTPNLDRLAATGVLFQNAYCNVPVSGASRASLLTGVYPNYPVRFTSYDSYASREAPRAVSLPGWFTQHGYHTVSNGKVFHNITDHAYDWSEYPWRVNPEGYGSDWAEYNKWELWMNKESGCTLNPKTMRGPFCESADVPDDAYDDGKATERTIADLARLASGEEPFFLACGFWRPHLPFNAPKRYWDLYDRQLIPLAENQYRSEGLPKEVVSPTEIFSYARVTDTSDEDFQREAKHGYYASVSYVDAQVGRILHALDSLGLADNTVVLFFGDHGWQLGEHSFWGKHTLMERATHVPLLVRAPGMKQGRTLSPVEFVDLFPTLCDLCGLPQPENQLDGTSFVPILRDLNHRTKEHVYIQWQGGDDVSDEVYNYAVWKKPDGTVREMLFDHRRDPEENTNAASESAYRKVKRRLTRFIREKRAALRSFK